MKLKDISKKFQEKFQGNKEEKSAEEVVQKKVIQPMQDENTDMTVKEVARQIIELLNKSPEDKRKEIIQELRKSKVISSEILVESAVQAADSEEVPDKLAVELAVQVSDKTTLGILKNAEISGTDRVEIIKTLTDDNLKEDAVCKELRKIYDELKEIVPQRLFAEKIKDFIDALGIERTDKVNKELYSVIAKNFAMTYYHQNGSMSLFQMEQLVPINEMIREKMPEKIEQEYEQLLKRGEENQFDLREVESRFLEQMAKETHEKAKKEEQTESTFMKYLGEITEEQATTLAEYIRKYNPDVEQKEIDKCLRIAKGEESESIYEPVQQDDKDNLETVSNKEMEVIEQCINSGLIETLSKMSEQERKDSLYVINQSLKKRVNKDKEPNVQTIKKDKVIPKELTPKVKKAEWGDDPR